MVICVSADSSLLRWSLLKVTFYDFESAARYEMHMAWTRIMSKKCAGDLTDSGTMMWSMARFYFG